MKLKSLLTAFFVMLTTFAMAQVENGKVYRIVSSKYGTVVSESPVMHTLSCTPKGDAKSYQEMWKFTATEDGRFTIRNVFTQRYVQYETGRNVKWKTGLTETPFAVTENEKLKGHYNIDLTAGKNWGMHCDGSSNIVPWSYGPEEGEVTGTEWIFEEVTITEEEMAAAYTEFQDFITTLDNVSTIKATVENLFQDNAGTVLKDEYAAMSDDELVAAMAGVPTDLQQAVLKIKNNTWAAREKEFRVYDYKPYSEPEEWNDILYTRLYSPLDNPTGINSSSNKSYIYVFVDEIPEGTYITLREISGTHYFGNDTPLKEGLNIIPATITDGVHYIRYICDTHTGFDGPAKTGPKKLADYPAVKIHIEGGYVNGFWSKERGHTNEDWAYMQQNMFKNPAAIQAKGKYSLLSFRKAEFLAACPVKITELVSLWDFWNETQQKFMALDKYYDYFNNLQLAMSDDTGFMDAGNHRTHYNNNTLSTICNYDMLLADAGSTWGPNHEIGHNNQYVYEIVGTSEVSNNGFANMVTFEQGTHTSRGNNLNNQILDFENKVPYVLRGEGQYGQKLFSMTRMYFQLFLYAHAAGKCPDFYPRLHEKLRYDRLIGWSVNSWDEMDENGFYKNSVNALNDQLKFAEACCEILQMDLSEFFEAWGFFFPFKNGFVGDYGHHWVYLLEEDAKASKARMQKYEKKGGHLMFLEDRIRPSKRKESPFCDGTGYRESYADWEGERVGDVGDFGQWMDYIDETVKAQGYYYAVSNGKVIIKEAEGASGALGFKLYNADTNELLTFTNRKKMNIPTSAEGVNLKVVAAQADGTDYVVPSAAEGPEEMQLAALEASLLNAKVIIGKKATSNTIVGYYYPEAIADLEAVYNEALAAKNNGDTSKYSYAEWSVMLDDERNKVLDNPDARILIKEAATFTARKAVGTNRGRYLDGGYPVATAVTNTGDINWVIEYAGKAGEYYMKNASSGYYITGIGMNTSVFTDTKEQANAIKFNVGYNTDGWVLFTLADNADLALGIDGSKEPNVIGVAVNDNNAQWRVDIKEDNSAEFYKNTLNELATEANYRITEILNLDSLQTMNIFNENIIVKDNNLNTYALNLLDTYYEVTEKMEGATVVEMQKFVNTLRKQLADIEGKYIVTAPIATEGERVVWYYLISNKSDKFASIYRGSSASNKDRVAMKDEVDDFALWSFASTGKAGEYKVYNAGNEGFMYKNGTSKIHTSAEEDYLPVTVTYDTNNDGLLLTTGGKTIYDAGTYMSISGTKSYWRLDIALIETNKEVADIITSIESVLPEADGNSAIYDLSGRRVQNPTRGICIQNGKKVLVK